MNDVATNTTATVSIGVTVVTAIGATVSAVLGIEMQAVLWAMIGGFFGAALGPPINPWISVIRYIFASLLSALAASIIERKLDGGTDPELRNLLAGALSFGFYPITQSMVSRLDSLLGVFVTRWLGQTVPPAVTPPAKPATPPPENGSPQ